MKKVIENIWGQQQEVNLCTWKDIKANDFQVSDRSLGTLNDGTPALFFCHTVGGNWYVTTETLEEIEAQEREEKACTEVKDNLLYMTIIFEKLYAINEKGYYTTWFSYAGHTKDLSISIVKGKWKANSKGKTVVDRLYGINGNTISDKFSGKKYTRREVLSELDQFIKNPTNKTK